MIHKTLAAVLSGNHGLKPRLSLQALQIELTFFLWVALPAKVQCHSVPQGEP